MTAAPVSRQGLVQAWLVQMVTAVVVCGAVMIFARNGGMQLGNIPEDWKRYVIFGILIASGPALMYLRRYKAILKQDERLERERGGVPDPAARLLLRRALSLGGALCDIPMALGALQLFLGGETRWFLGATMVAIALRLSYRPFFKKP